MFKREKTKHRQKKKNNKVYWELTFLILSLNYPLALFIKSPFKNLKLCTQNFDKQEKQPKHEILSLMKVIKRTEKDAFELIMRLINSINDDSVLL